MTKLTMKYKIIMLEAVIKQMQTKSGESNHAPEKAIL
jgi:hypothetical protein